MAATSGRSGNFNKTRQSEFRCHRSNKLGHFRKDCKVKLPENSEELGSVKETWVKETCWTASGDTWNPSAIRMDSGATRHMFNSKTMFQTCDMLET